MVDTLLLRKPKTKNFTLMYLQLVQVAREQKYPLIFVRFIFILWLIIFLLFLWRFIIKCSCTTWRRAPKEKSQHWNMRVWKCKKLLFTFVIPCPIEKKTGQKFSSITFLNTSFLFLFLPWVACWDHIEPWTIRARRGLMKKKLRDSL